MPIQRSSPIPIPTEPIVWRPGIELDNSASSRKSDTLTTKLWRQLFAYIHSYCHSVGIIYHSCLIHAIDDMLLITAEKMHYCK